MLCFWCYFNFRMCILESFFVFLSDFVLFFDNALSLLWFAMCLTLFRTGKFPLLNFSSIRHEDVSVCSHGGTLSVPQSSNEFSSGTGKFFQSFCFHVFFLYRKLFTTQSHTTSKFIRMIGWIFSLQSSLAFEFCSTFFPWKLNFKDSIDVERSEQQVVEDSKINIWSDQTWNHAAAKVPRLYHTEVHTLQLFILCLMHWPRLERDSRWQTSAESKENRKIHLFPPDSFPEHRKTWKIIELKFSLLQLFHVIVQSCRSRLWRWVTCWKFQPFNQFPRESFSTLFSLSLYLWR